MTDSTNENNDWYPSKREYDPGIKEKQWEQLVVNESIFTKNSLITFACIQNATSGTCAGMAKQYGRSANFYNINVSQTGKRIADKLKIPLRENGEQKYWLVCCLARRTGDSHYEFKIRPELEAALNKTGVLKGVELMEEKEMKWLFSNWMRKTGKENGEPYSENTITSYCNAMNNAPQKLEIDQQYQKSIFSYTDINEYNKVKKIILAAPNFDVENKKAGSQALGAGMTLYEQFLNEVSNKKKILESNKTFQTNNLKGKLSDLLEHTHNLIFHGAPGTGKTHLAKEIAKAMGAETAFVQFHPSYDYTDFVEGLRPVPQDDAGQIGFELRDGVFKTFCERALENLLNSQKTETEMAEEQSLDEKIDNFIDKSIEENIKYTITQGNEFFIINADEKNIYISIPNNEKANKLTLKKSEIITLLKLEENVEGGNTIRDIFGRKWRTQQDSYTLSLYKSIKNFKNVATKKNVVGIDKKPFVFIIDEINRGDLSKIFGELFYALDPGYRVTAEALKAVKAGESFPTIRTQYANMERDGNTFDNALNISKQDDFGHFFVPENVYIIGTMNDIDRSVETMDFAFRRRFTFAEIRASDRVEMLDEIEDAAIRQQALDKMKAINAIISETEGLSSAYHIGGAYFLKLKTLDNDFKKLWDYHLAPLIKEYLRGTEDESETFNKIKQAYDAPTDSSVSDSSQETE